MDFGDDENIEENPMGGQLKKNMVTFGGENQLLDMISQLRIHENNPRENYIPQNRPNFPEISMVRAQYEEEMNKRNITGMEINPKINKTNNVSLHMTQPQIGQMNIQPNQIGINTSNQNKTNIPIGKQNFFQKPTLNKSNAGINKQPLQNPNIQNPNKPSGKNLNYININQAQFTQNIYLNVPNQNTIQETQQRNIQNQQQLLLAQQQYQRQQQINMMMNNPLLNNQIPNNQMMGNHSLNNQMMLNNQMLMNNPMLQQYMNNSSYQQQQVLSKKINFNNIITGQDRRTTLMLRNIPNKYNLSNIVDEIGEDFWGKFDCVSLPVDYETKLNLGYAFINFTDPFHIIQFYKVFYQKKWSRYRSEKKMDMSYADKQGRKDISLRADNTYFPEDDKRYDFLKMKPLVEIPAVRIYF
ncbi:MAG: hypothetical protein MJ252_26415 [archaeon]|nr:hypothetical protein [archaeon]